MLFIGYSWKPGEVIDLYQRGLVDAFKKLGFNVSILSAVDICPHDRVEGIDPSVDIIKLVKIIKDVAPTLIVSMNNGGLHNQVKTATTAPIFNLIVDEIYHLFAPELPLLSNVVAENNYLVLTCKDSVNFFKKELPPSYHKNILVLPNCTDIFPEASMNFVHNISFFGSYLGTDLAQNIFQSAFAYDDSRKTLSKILTCRRRIQNDYHGDLNQTISDLGLDKFLTDINLSPAQLKYELSCHISSVDRLKMVKTLYPLGITLFGNQGWKKALSLTPKYLDCFRPGHLLNTRKKIHNFYNSSKIAIHIPQVQVQKCLAYRVYDILSSNALLILPYHEDSDAILFFGEDHPIPMYKTISDLLSICEYFLSHENERRAIVKTCNLIVANGFSFEDRAIDFLNHARIDFNSDSDQQGAEHNIKLEEFQKTNPKNKIKSLVRNALFLRREKITLPGPIVEESVRNA